jgi:hypothetical protein
VSCDTLATRTMVLPLAFSVSVIAKPFLPPQPTSRICAILTACQIYDWLAWLYISLERSHFLIFPRLSHSLAWLHQPAKPCMAANRYISLKQSHILFFPGFHAALHGSISLLSLAWLLTLISALSEAIFYFSQAFTQPCMAASAC